jgi:hypothetical protein
MTLEPLVGLKDDLPEQTRNMRVSALLLALPAAAAFLPGAPIPSLRASSLLPSSLCVPRMAAGNSELASRRQALASGFFSFAGIAAAAMSPSSAGAETVNGYTLPPLPYAYNALEPYMDEETMRIHHDKHFQAYLTNLNKQLEKFSLRPIPLTKVQKYAFKDETPEYGPVIRNNGGGFYNHGLFFNSLGPASSSGAPSPALATAIDASFGSIDQVRPPSYPRLPPATRREL